jgi:hypothetical protein
MTKKLEETLSNRRHLIGPRALCHDECATLFARTW